MGFHLEQFLAFLNGKNHLTNADYRQLTRLISSSEEPYDHILTRLGLIEESPLLALLSDFTQLPNEQINRDSIDENLSTKYNVEFLKENRIVPLRENGKTSKIALVNPFDQNALSALEFALGTPPDICLMTNSNWEQVESYIDKDPEPEDNIEDIDSSFDEGRLADWQAQNQL